MLNSLPLLSILVWLPITAGIWMLIRPLRYVPIATSVISLMLTAYIFSQFDAQNWQMQLLENYAWIKAINVNYSLGIDGISLLLGSLTVFMTLLVNLAAFTQVDAKQFASYSAAFLIMQGLMCGVFFALDAVLFYVFFEAMMIPMFLIIGLWGGANRIYATLKFILYTFVGSLFLLVAILYLHSLAQDFAITSFQQLTIPLTPQKWLCAGLLLAFAVKIPMWPLHTWLPDAHTEAPTGGSVILAAITLKIGAYGMLRFMLPIVPQACLDFAPVILALSLIAIVYIGLVAIVQQDMKRLIAYSSIAHMGFVTLGMFVGYLQLKNVPNAALALQGSVVQMLSHGLVSGALFLCVGVLYKRLHTRLINDYGGVVNSMPLFASFFMLFALANVGLPGTSGFVGEFLVILASFKANIWIATLAATTLVLGVSYTLWMYKRVVFGEIKSQTIAALKDLTPNEYLAFTLVAIMILLIGIWPQTLLGTMQAATDHLALQALQFK